MGSSPLCVSFEAGLRDGIVSQLEQMGLPNLTILEEGMEIHLWKIIAFNEIQIDAG